MIDRLIVNIFEWAAGHQDEGRYSPVGIAFHWTMAVLVFFQLGWGWWMGRMPVGGDKVGAYEIHFFIGVLMLVLALMRFGWRTFAPDLVNDADKPGWESVAAHITHYVFYTCLIGLPLTGWAMVSATARDEQLTFLGLFDWPLMPMQMLSNPMLWWIESAAEWMHWGLILSLLLMIPIHAGAALKHQIIDRDDVLHAMAPVVPMPTRRRTRWQRRYRALEKQVGVLASGLGRLFQPRSGRRRPAP